MLPSQLSIQLTKSQLSFLENFFSTANQTFFRQLILKTYPANHLLIDTADPCTYVYILLSGRLQAIEEQFVTEPYYFTELSAIEIVGDFELFTSSANRAITLTTMEESLVLIIPSALYLSWIRHDSHALFIRMQMLIRQFMSQSQSERYNLFQDTKSRLIYFLSQECQKQKLNFPIKIHYTRPVIASKLGCSVRTINRTIHSLEKQKILTLIHGKIYISAQQLEKLQELLPVFSLTSPKLPDW